MSYLKGTVPASLPGNRGNGGGRWLGLCMCVCVKEVVMCWREGEERRVYEDSGRRWVRRFV